MRGTLQLLLFHTAEPPVRSSPGAPEDQETPKFFRLPRVRDLQRARTATWVFVAIGFVLPGDASATLTAGIRGSRTQGYAPLAVHMDGFTNSRDTTRDGGSPTATARKGERFLELIYEWNFDDPNAGAWRNSALDPAIHLSSKNQDSQPATAHIFDPQRVGDGFDQDPCTIQPVGKTGVACRQYTVVLSVRNPEGDQPALARKTITVWDPDDVDGLETHCFATNSDMAGCPTGATHHTNFSDFSAAINTYGGANRQLLFHRAQTFTASQRPSVSPSESPMRIGAFGSGSGYAVVNDSATGCTDQLTGFLDFDQAVDVVVQQLELTGPGSTGVCNSNIIQSDWGQNNSEHLVLYRLDADGYNNLIGLGETGDPDAAQYFFLIEVENQGIVDGSGGRDRTIWMHCLQCTVMGNEVYGNATAGHGGSGGGQRHTFRLMLSHTAVVAHNVFRNSGSGKALMTSRCCRNVHGPCTTALKPIELDMVCRYNTFHHNKFTASGGSAQVGFNPDNQNECLEQRQQYWIWEGNVSRQIRTGVRIAFAFNEDDGIVRNNACEFSRIVQSTNSTAAVCISVAVSRSISPCQQGPDPEPERVLAYNNSSWVTEAVNPGTQPWGLTLATLERTLPGNGNVCDNSLIYGGTAFSDGAHLASCRSNVAGTQVNEPGGLKVLASEPNPYAISTSALRAISFADLHIDDFRIGLNSAALGRGTPLPEVPRDAGGSCRESRIGGSGVWSAGAWEADASGTNICMADPGADPLRPPAAPTLLP